MSDKANRNVELTLRLTWTQLDQLRAYVRWAGNEGTYYGNKQQFVARHKRIKEALGIEDEPDSWDYQ